MKCPRCQAENREGALFCRECGATFGAVCSSCGAKVAAGSKFCDGCGAPLRATPASGPKPSRFTSPESYTPKHLAEKILTSKTALEGERKQLTVLFCDIANSTALAERLGPEAMHTLLNQFFEFALNEVHRYEGTINQFLGDGFMALFGAPLAHEDHARRAVLAALGIRQTITARQGELAGEHGVKLSIRMGLHTGLVVVGKIGDNLRMDYTAVGDTTNLAARLQQLARPGKVYLSESTQRAVVEHFQCRRLGERNVKGKIDPITVFELVGPEAPRSRPDQGGIGSPLVGREPELAALAECFERLLAGHGGIVFVIGEAGLGKSRLVTEARRQFADGSLLWLEGRALAYGQTISYWPFLEILRTCAGIHDDDRPDASWAKLEHCITALFPDQVADILPYLATLLALEVRGTLVERVKYLDGEAMGRHVFRASRRFFERLAQQHPVVLLFEDLHWMDQSSTELLEHLFPLTEIVPLLVCGVSRPDRGTPAARLQQTVSQKGPERYSELRLTQLSTADSVQFVRNLLDLDNPSPRLQDLILAKAEGNPFFIEEVVRALIAVGVLARDAESRTWRLTDRARQITIPDTIQGVIMARIDRLADDVKHVLRIAAVIGRSFLYRVLRAITEPDLDLDPRLADLQQLEVVREKRRLPELEYIFKHALVQETTYESILTQHRRRLHRQVAECIETLFAERLEEFYGLLAFHYARAEEWGKAQEYLVKTGDQAGRIAADAEALAHYRLALTAYERAFGDRWDPLQRAILERKMGEAFFRRGDHQEAIEYLRRALALLGAPYPTSRWGIRLVIAGELVRQVGHRLWPRPFLKHGAAVSDVATEERSRVYELMAWIDYFIDQERVILDGLMQLNSSERSGLSVGVVRGSTIVGIMCDQIPLPRLSAQYHRRAVALAERVQHPVALGLAYLGLAFHQHVCLGIWDSALENYHRAATAYRNAGDLRGWGAATGLSTALLHFRGDLTHSLEQAQELVRAGQDGADQQMVGYGFYHQGWTRMQAGALDDAVANIQKAMECFRAVPDYAGVAEASGLLGQSLLRRGEMARALAILEESNHLIARNGWRGHQIWSTRHGLATASLAAVEHAAGAERVMMLKRAKLACRAALKQSRALCDAVPSAYRLWGTYEWLTGRPAAAEVWWKRSLAAAQRLSARYDLGMAYLEMGQRLRRRADVERAETIFAELGAELDLVEARRFLEPGCP